MEGEGQLQTSTILVQELHTGVRRHPDRILACNEVPRGGEEERILVERAKCGDKEAFGAIVSLYEGRITAYCISYLDGRGAGCREDAQDIVQETFLKAYIAITGQRDHGAGAGVEALERQLGSWLYRIATNNCLDWLRRRRLYRAVPWEYFDDHPGDTPCAEGAAGDPSIEYERADRCKEVLHVLELVGEQRAPKYKQALRLKYGYRLRATTVAQRLGYTPSAVKSMVHRARSDFRALYLELYGA